MKHPEYCKTVGDDVEKRTGKGKALDINGGGPCPIWIMGSRINRDE